MLLTNPSAAGEPGASSPKTCSRTPGANLDAQPAYVEYFVSLMRVRSSIAPKYARECFRLAGRAYLLLKGAAAHVPD
jgi:hypothetical protein